MCSINNDISKNINNDVKIIALFFIEGIIFNFINIKTEQLPNYNYNYNQTLNESEKKNLLIEDKNEQYNNLINYKNEQYPPDWLIKKIYFFFAIRYIFK